MATSTVHAALQYALLNYQEVGITVCFISFDQPLYIKAREITFGTIVMRFCGFDILMSYMGCIDQTMAGSGMKDVLCEVFIVNSVDKMLIGYC